MSTLKQIVLSAKSCSGRGVRIQMLSLEQRGAVLEAAAKEVGAEATMLQFRIREGAAGTAAMVVEVTEKAGFKSAAELIEAGDGAKWKKVGAQELAEHPEKYFNAKDQAALLSLFRALHDVDDKEIDSILGEAQDVTVD